VRWGSIGSAILGALAALVGLGKKKRAKKAAEVLKKAADVAHDAAPMVDSLGKRK
jgi:hypothetical protein